MLFSNHQYPSSSSTTTVHSSTAEENIARAIIEDFTPIDLDDVRMCLCRSTMYIEETKIFGKVYCPLENYTVSNQPVVTRYKNKVYWVSSSLSQTIFNPI